MARSCSVARPVARPRAFAPKQQCRPVRRTLAVRAAAASSPPTVADAKAAFLSKFSKPLPALYSTVVLELLVQQHIYRWSTRYAYSEVTALGIFSIFEQILDGLPQAERDAVFDAFVTALQEDPARYRADAAKLESWAAQQAVVTPDPDGDEVQQALARVAGRISQGAFLYTKFFAVGLFRLLELTGSKDPKSLSALVSALGVPQDRVTADLTTYKGVLSKLQAAKEIMREFLEREKKKAAERLAAKAEGAASSSQPADAAA